MEIDTVRVGVVEGQSGLDEGEGELDIVSDERLAHPLAELAVAAVSLAEHRDDLGIVSTRDYRFIYIYEYNKATNVICLEERSGKGRVERVIETKAD